MADKFDLIAEIREDSGKGASRRRRREGKVPAIRSNLSAMTELHYLIDFARIISSMNPTKTATVPARGAHSNPCFCREPPAVYRGETPLPQKCVGGPSRPDSLIHVQRANRFFVRNPSHGLAEQLRRGELANLFAGRGFFIQRNRVGNDDLIQL